MPVVDSEQNLKSRQWGTFSDEKCQLQSNEANLMIMYSTVQHSTSTQWSDQKLKRKEAGLRGISAWNCLLDNAFAFGLFRLVQCQFVSEEVLVGTKIPGSRGRGRLHLTLHCHHQKDCCMMGSNDSHFNDFCVQMGRSDSHFYV